MRFVIQPASSEPIYAQVVRQVREGVATGRLRAGDRLPSVRDLARDLVINPNTIAAAYRDLERAGLIHTHRGRGTFIAEPPEAGPARERRRLLQKHVDALLTEAAHLGLTEEEIMEQVRESLKRFRLGGLGHE